MTRVLVFGTFDRLHPGHTFLLRSSSERGELWIVVARDENVFRMKGRKPEQSEKKRMQSIAEAFPSAQVILGDAQDFLAPVRFIAPDLILLGYDQQLPPGVSPVDLPCPVERLPAYKPEQYKSSLRRAQGVV